VSQPLETPPETSPPSTTDINIDNISLRACRFEDRLFDHVVLQEKPAAEGHGAGEGITLNTNIDVWLDTENRSALVRLVVDVEPEQQPSWAASVECLGQYSVGDHPVIPLEKFAWSNGIAYLVPYARERLANLTSAGPFGTYILPPLSVPKLLELSRTRLQARRGGSADSAFARE
jgi:preprotein translocase subunit SecB